MLELEYLAGLGREEKAGIEGRLFEMAVLEPSSKQSLGSLGSLGLCLAAGSSLIGSHKLCIAGVLLISRSPRSTRDMVPTCRMFDDEHSSGLKL